MSAEAANVSAEAANVSAEAANVSAEAALTQVDQLARQSFRHLRTGWPTCMAVQQTKAYKLLNLSGRRFGAHINGLGAHIN